jgi:mono/diheme cytochrome c family protein
VKRTLITILLVGGPLSLVPFALIARARVTTTTTPRIHLIHDMDNQVILKAQDENAVFADGRAMRLPVAGTVARGELMTDDHYYRGIRDGNWAVGFPSQVEVDRDLLERGRERYDIHCAVCHGYAGGAEDDAGAPQMGPVHVRAEQLKAKGDPGLSWVPPTALATQENLFKADPANQNYGSEGYLFHVITNGVRNMAAYGSQVSVHDRWAIVAYLRALQRSQNPGGGDK